MRFPLPSVSVQDNFCSSFLFLLFESPFIFVDLPEIMPGVMYHEIAACVCAGVGNLYL